MQDRGAPNCARRNIRDNMTYNLRKFISLSLVFTAVTLVYVYQNIEIVTLGYAITKNQTAVTSSVDEERKLLYNLNRLESPILLSARLNEERIELVQANAGNIYLAKSMPSNKIGTAVSGNETNIRFFAKLFDVMTAKAEAKN
jgi:hypothetical protein